MNTMLISIVEEVLLHLSHKEVVRRLHGRHAELRETHHLLIWLIRLEEITAILLILVHVVVDRIPCERRVRISSVNLSILTQTENSVQKSPWDFLRAKFLTKTMITQKG